MSFSEHREKFMPPKAGIRRPASEHRINLQFLRRTVRLARPYWFSNEKRKAWSLLLLLVALLVGYTEFAVLFNHQAGEFTSALAARDGARFWHAVWVFFGLILFGVPIDAYYYYVRDNLALHWRRWLTDHFLGRYLKNRRYYRLLSNPEIDNPDQRMSDDIAAFTQQSLNFILVFANALFQLIAFSSVLWTISTSLVIILFLYAAVVTTATFGIFGERMVSLNFAQRRREADFRFNLVRLRENAEAIAFYRGEHQEQTQLNAVFSKLFSNSLQIIRWALRLNFFYYTNSFLAMILPTLIIAPRVLSGELEVGRVVQATGAFSAILGALTILVDNLENLSRFAASIGRLETFSRSLSAQGAPTTNGDHALGEGKIQTEHGPEIGFDHVTLATPGQDRTLVRDLTFAIPAGCSLMIVGTSGVGKSSLLRALAGLWDTGHGTLMRPKKGEMLFLPQHAYMPVGSLRAQLHYPDLDEEISDEDLLSVLKLVNLPDLAERCGGFDAEYDFEKLLSVGERQRLALARVFLKKPRYALLDEATSALDPENESKLYEKLARTSTTFVSVSHHPSLVKYHSHILELKPDGSWGLHEASKFRFVEDFA